jgi:hypothetical protein
VLAWPRDARSDSKDTVCYRRLLTTLTTVRDRQLTGDSPWNCTEYMRSVRPAHRFARPTGVPVPVNGLLPISAVGSAWTKQQVRRPLRFFLASRRPGPGVQLASCSAPTKSGYICLLACKVIRQLFAKCYCLRTCLLALTCRRSRH